MKGSQGLEALATLCGGARKAPDNENTQPNNGADQPGPAPAAQVQQVTLPRQLDHYTNSSFNNNRSKNDSNTAPAQQQQQMNQMNPQIAALLNAGINQQNIANKMNSNDGTMALQQMVYLNLLQNQNSAVSKLLNQQQASSPQFVDQNTLAMVLALQQQQKAQHEVASNHFQSQNLQHDQQQSQFRSLLQSNNTQSQNQNLNSSNNNTLNAQSTSFQQGLSKVKTSDVPMVNTSSGTQMHQPILMRHPTNESAEIKSVHGDASQVGTIGSDEGRERSNSALLHPEDKKLLKRAANRRSAQLSRKRKKQFIETLKEENADLRRMELILRSIPDLVISFDSSGKIGFVSQSVCKFLSFTPEELEGKSFWDRLCEDSVRLLKAAFMDALAARENESTSTPLGSGVWQLRLQDKNKENIMVTLNGVVHFTGDAPECVCSIRLCDTNGESSTAVDQTVSVKKMKPTILPQQSVFSNGSIGQNKTQDSVGAPVKEEQANRGVKRVSAQISDVDSSSAGD